MSTKAASGHQLGTIDTKEHHMAAKKPPAGKADPPESTPGATNGEPNDDELERRRKARSGSSLAERIDAGEGDGEAQTEAFPLGTLSGDPRLTVKNLIKAGSKVTTEVSMTKAGVPNPDGGLFDPEEEASVLVRVLPGPAKQVPIHGEEVGGRHKIKEWKISQELRVIHVQAAGDMYTRVQVLELLNEAGVSSAVISRLLGEEAKSAQA